MFLRKAIAAALMLLLAAPAYAAPTLMVAVNLPRAVLYAHSDGRWYRDRDHDFTKEIMAAKQTLSHMTAGYALKREAYTRVVRKQKKTAYRVVRAYNILLAVKRARDGVVIIKIGPDGSNHDGFVVDWSRANGVNTDFIVRKPEGFTLLAIKRSVRTQNGYQEVVYTPFTDDIDTPAMRQRGLRYLRATLEQAYTNLLNANVRSLAFPGRRVAAVIPVKTALALSIIEHIDPSRLAHEKIENLVDEVLVTVAANRDEAYKYAVSRTGARGLFQFMPGTYRRVAHLYPRARLDRNFVTGMNAHVNGAQATLLLFDADLERLPLARRTWIVDPKTDPHYAAVYLAASYNGGAPRVVAAITKGGTWTKKLRPETQLYIVKLDKVIAALHL